MRDQSTLSPTLLLSEWPEEDRLAYVKDPFTGKSKRKLLSKITSLRRQGLSPFVHLRDDGELRVCVDLAELGRGLSDDDRRAVVSCLEQCNYEDEFAYCARAKPDWLMTQLVHVSPRPAWQRWFVSVCRRLR